MPALKLSYDYLPFDLKQCFSYFALFPEDYEFGSEELIHLWIGLGILHSSDHNKRIEDIGMSYLNDLVNHGFLKKNEKDDGSSYYIVHDLLHELAVKVSSYECLSIRSSSVRSVKIPPYVRHLSIIIENTVVKDRMTFENFKKEMIALGKRLKVENLRTLMLFGEHHGSFVNIFGDLLREARAFRTIYLSGLSYNVDKDMLFNFSKLVHLRYLRIKSVWNADLCFPTSLVRLYHLEVPDLKEWIGSFRLKGHISNLVELRHFLVPYYYEPSLHAGIYEVGKLEFLQELRKFNVRNENGFELSQLGKLAELGGSLQICDLEKVQTKEEADESKLIHKSRLHKLELEWNISRTNKDPTREKDVLESLRPHSNLQNLCIKGHGGINCPTWLGANLCVKNLEYLELHNMPWIDLPPLGDMFLVDESGEEHLCCTQSPIFNNLKFLRLSCIQRLRKWAVSCPHSVRYQNLKRLELTKTTNVESSCGGNGARYFFNHLKVLIIHDCPELFEVPFFHPICCQQEAPWLGFLD
ncbi:hypothetical protein PAHAL_6G072800 [Panicum hallii]|uniref:NB-ARC domain-containing protein n=1 Tax=Panicum hallii TaxID=206008 RepID=A0A2T8IFI3_9POAL|nr:hypothetical protein PAHAL_6G072800 [Panicum hallii]